jgi:osmotically-inducible protein OsmY
MRTIRRARTPFTRTSTAMSIRLLRALPAAAMLFTVMACGNTADGVREDTENASERVAESDVGQSMSAGTKTADVKAALLADSVVAGTDIDVDTNEDTRTVTLTGAVPSEAVRARAEQVTRDNASGYTVVNNLTVGSR